jgi:site-specific recombinase XerD
MSSDFKELLLEEMAIRSLSTNTKRAYIRSMKGLCNYFKRNSRSNHGERYSGVHIVHAERKAVGSKNDQSRDCSLQVFLHSCDGWVWSADALPKQKAPRHVPVVLSEAEVASMIEACDNGVVAHDPLT